MNDNDLNWHIFRDTFNYVLRYKNMDWITNDFYDISHIKNFIQQNQ